MNEWHTIIQKAALLIIQKAVLPIASLLIALVLLSLLLLAVGKDPVTTIAAIFRDGFGSKLGIGETLIRATPLLLCALAAAIPARAGLFNIGGEGQLHLGAVAATSVALYAPWIPAPLVIPAMILAAMVAGGLYGALPGVLRGRFQVNEVLVCLMLNYVGILFVEYLVHGPWKDPSALGWPYTASFPESAILPQWGDTSIHLGLALGILAAVLVFLFMATTIWGFSIKVLDANPATARYVKINVAKYIVILMAIGGACAALAGMGEVSVVQGRLRPGISPGYGYTGFIISWLSGHNPLVIIPVALLIGGIYSGADALQLTAGLPGATVDILMGLVFFTFLLSSYIQERRQKHILEGGAKQ
jgi:ABC-type uncharacterized transport system permease subunit